MNSKTKKLTMLAMLCAIAYVVMVVGRIPMVLFLKYDPKDIVITIGGFIFGPLSAFMISLIVSLVEWFTVSGDGFIGFIMNVIASVAFACTASLIYKKKHTLKGAVAGLIAGTLLMTGVMLLWNYFLAPIFMGYEREAVVELLIPAFLPFNLIKGSINAAVTMFLYKPVVTALRKAGLIPSPAKDAQGGGLGGRFNLGVMLVSALVLVTCIMLVLVIRGVI